MAKWIVSICVMSLIFLGGCGNKEVKQVEKEPTLIKQVPTDILSQETEDPAEKPKDPVYKLRFTSELADLGEGELWKVYKECRTRADKAKNRERYQESINLLLKGAEAAIKLEKPGIASWQFNNAAKHAIEYYQAESEYKKRMRKLTKIKHGDEKIAYKKDTKTIMKDYFKILKEAEGYLNAATKYNEMDNDSERVSAIESNMGFVKEIEGFLE